jgi:hypothetical protein
MLPIAPTTPTDANGARVLTWLEADRLSPHDVIERWRRLEPAALHLDEPEHHLEELALMTVACRVADSLAAHLRPPCDPGGRYAGPGLRCRWDWASTGCTSGARVGRRPAVSHHRWAVGPCPKKRTLRCSRAWLGRSGGMCSKQGYASNCGSSGHVLVCTPAAQI